MGTIVFNSLKLNINICKFIIIRFFILFISPGLHAIDVEMKSECAEFRTHKLNFIGKLCNVSNQNRAIFSVSINETPGKIMIFYLEAESNPILIVQKFDALHFYDSKNSKPGRRTLLGIWKTNLEWTGGIYFSKVISRDEISATFQRERVGVKIQFLGERKSTCTKTNVRDSVFKETVDQKALVHPRVVRAMNNLALLIYSRCSLSKNKNFKYEGIRVSIPSP